MDLVTRLKQFISFKNLPVTQFADSCGIPRPTLSQLLNGRNKKVSDEFISKIHDSYPELSVLWLMFGEGDMIHGANIETSEPQKAPFIEFSDRQSSIKEPTNLQLDFGDVLMKKSDEKIEFEASENPTSNDIDFSITSGDESSTSDDNSESDSSAEAESTSMSFTGTPQSATGISASAPQTIKAECDRSRRIINIIVYYDDNSFQSFVPSTKG